MFDSYMNSIIVQGESDKPTVVRTIGNSGDK